MADNTEFLSIKTDLDEAMKLFDGLEKESPKIRRRLLAGIGTTVKNKAKREYKALLKQKSGNLYKSLKRRVIKSGKAVVVDAKARAKNQVFYGYALAEGSTITAKSQKYLTFQVDGKWVKKESVKLPENDYISKPAERYLGSAEYRQQIDRLVQKEIDKLEQKGIVISK